MADLSSLPGCMGMGKSYKPNACGSCQHSALCRRLRDDDILKELQNIKDELKKTRIALK